MLRSHLEVERTFAPQAATALPDLTVLAGVLTVVEVDDAELDAAYFDTPDLALLRAGVSLRRREGGSDEGWHLKLPMEGRPTARDELHESLDEGTTPPRSLSQLVRGWTRDAALAEVARIHTHRTTRHLLDNSGTVLAAVVDDVVVGSSSRPDAQPVRWREWEVELVDSEVALLDAVTDLLAEHGVPPSPVQRKIAVVLGDLSRPGSDLVAPSKKGPARLVVHLRVAEQVRALELLDPALRRVGGGGVHAMRKACTRLRAVLATCRPLVDAGRTDPIRDELQWLARSLSVARDDEVVHAGLQELLDDQDPELVVGPVRDRLEHRREHRIEHDGRVIAELLDTTRYLELRAELARLVEDPPWTALAEESAASVLPGLVREDWKRLRRRHRRAGEWHEVRKATKRVRYAYESVEPVWGRAARPRRAAEELARLLGDHQDTLVARQVLLELSASATAAGESAFTYGRLHAIEEQRGADLLGEAVLAWEALKKVSW